MNKKDSVGEFYLDDLSDCLDCCSAKDEGINDNVDDNNGTWSTNDKNIILEPFEGSSGVKIMPSSSKSVIDIANLFIGSDLIEHFVRESNRYHYQIVEK
ncbi:hypothetical protein M0804_013879 [Polistes exclamans]|nr:hypothetical protein M0804_013879 [Polistes exclamans]